MLNEALPIVAITIYAKNETSDLTGEERKGARAIVAAVTDELKARQGKGVR